MTELNPNTKKAKGFVHSYASAKAGSTLYSVYKSCSSKKEKAWKYCLQDMEDHDGYDMRITGHSCDIFTCAYKVRENGRVYLAYHTPCYCYKIDLYPNAESC